MTGTLTVVSASPGVTVQDAGRAGFTGIGLSRGGAADRLALAEIAALLGDAASDAVIEIAGIGGAFKVDRPTRFALAGAAMQARIDGRALEPFATHRLAPGQTLTTGAVTGGVYGYLAVAGGLATPKLMGGRGAHLLARLGEPLPKGESLKFNDDPAPESPSLRLRPERDTRGPIRLMPGPQTALFSTETLDRFVSTAFTRSVRGNRQGVRFDHDGAGFATEDQLQLVSDFTAEGDVQMTGDGRPFVLMSEHQTTGGYPRIGTVIPADMPRIAQAAPGTEVRFSLISLDDADALYISPAERVRRLLGRVEPLVRDPSAADLHALNLVSGVTSAKDH